MKKKIKIFSIFSAVAALFIFSTCRVGLGSVVDTQVPELAISYPPESAVIRNSFLLSGTCSDDIAVKEVKVKLTNTDIGKTYGPFDAELNLEENTWSIVLNNKTEGGLYNGFEYCDGRYVADVQAKDKAGHKSSKASLSFDIDNTAPVLYLSKPFSKGSDDIVTTFGKQVKIAGEISENHAAVKLIAKFAEYDEVSKQFSAPVEIEINETIEISADTPLMVARYYSQEDCNGDQKKETLRNNYLALYPDADTEKNPQDKTLYCAFEVEDNAQEYNPNAVNEGRGNRSTRYFINGRNFQDILVSEKAYNLSAENMKNYLNGTSTILTDAQKKEVKKIIEEHPEFYVDSANVDAAASKFYLNPNNNPTYKVDGYGFTGSETRNTLVLSADSDTSLAIQVNSGKDNLLLKAKTLSVSIVSEEKDSDNNPIFTKTYIYSKEGDDEDTPENAVFWQGTDSDDLKDEIFINKTDGLISGSAYTIIVSGTDRDGNNVLPANGESNGYGFILSSQAAAPTVTIDESLSGKYYSAEQIKNEGITIPLLVSTDSVSFIETGLEQDLNNAIRIQSNQSYAGASVIRKNLTDVTSGLVSSGKTVYPAILSVQKPENYTSNGYEYSMSLKVGGDGNAANVDFNNTTGIYKYSFYVLALDANNKAGAAPFTFYVDNQAPEITNSTVSISEGTVKTVSKAEDSTNKWINGTAYLTAKVHDNYELADIRYWVYAKDSKGETLVAGGDEGISLGVSEEVSFSVDTAVDAFKPVVQENGTKEYKKLCVKIVAKDSVGNKKELKTDFDNTYVDQETDLPSVEAGNFTFVASKDDINSETNIFGKGTNLLGKISDDDGISNTSILTIKNSDGEEISSIQLVSEDIKVQVPAVTGFYTLEIKIVDTTWNAAESDAIKAYREKSYKTYIAVDNSAPEFEETNIGTEDTQYTKTGAKKFLFTLSDDLGFADSGYLMGNVLKDGVAVPEYTKSITEKDSVETEKYTYSFDFTDVDEADYDFEFIATDLAGKTSTVTRCITKDATGPVFGTEDDKKPRIVTAGVKDSDEKVWFNTQTLQIMGTASDTASGVAQVQYKINNAGDSELINGTTSFEKVITGLKNGDSIYITATDVAGNSSDAYILGPVYLDNVKPSITADSEDDILINGESELTITGKVKDNADANSIYGVSGIKQINIKCGESKFTSPDVVISNVTSSDATEKSWTAKIPADKLKAAFASSASGSGKIYAQVVDNAGITYETSIANIKYDNQYPEAKIDTVTYEGTDTLVTKANKSIVIKGTAKDNQQLVSLQLQYAELPDDNIDKWQNDAEWKDDSRNWKDYGSALTSNLYSWSYTVNTEDECFTDGKTYLFCVKATDKAGNEGNSFNTKDGDAWNADYAKIITIDKESDFPVITISNLSFDGNYCMADMTASVRGHLYNTNKVLLSVYDDDGVGSVEVKSGNAWSLTKGAITTTYYTVSETPAAGANLYTDSGCITKAKTESGTELTVKAVGSNKITVGTEDYSYVDGWKALDTADSFVIPVDGPHVIMFRVTDDKGRVFVSGNKDSNVIITDAEGHTPDSGDVKIYVDVDTTGPIINDSNNKYASAVKDSSDEYVYCDYNSDFSKVKFGGIYEKLKLSVKVRDPNGVKSVRISYDKGSKDAVCKTTEHSDGAEYEWEFKDIDLTEVDGKTQFELQLEDTTGNSSESSITIDVDNTPAELGIESHSQGEQVSTAFVLKGYLTGNDNETTIKYYIDATKAMDASEATTELKNIGGIFRINVDGKTSADDSEVHIASHKKLFVDAYGESKKIDYVDGLVVYSEDIKDADDNVIHAAGDKYISVDPLYFHFLVTDKCGNLFEYTHELQIDPQGDIPTVEITYPVYPKAGTAAEMDTFSGKIRAQGKSAAKGNNSVVGVYLQIDTNVDSDTPEFNEDLWIKTGSYNPVTDLVSPSLKDDSDNPKKLKDFYSTIENIYDRYNAIPGVQQKTSNMYGIYLGNTTAWSCTLNENGELDAETGKNSIGIRAYVVDSAGNLNILNTDNDVFVTLDSGAPQIGSDIPLYVYQYKWVNNSDAAEVRYTNVKAPADGAKLYTDSGCRTLASETYSAANYTADFISAEYKDGMSLKGEWWINGSAMDPSGITSLSVDNIVDNVTTNFDMLAANPDYATKVVYEIKDPEDETKKLRKGYEFNYRIGSMTKDAAGTLKYKIKASDGSDDSDYPISVSYDNKAPVLLSKDSPDFNISQNVKNDHGFYKLGSIAYEEGNQSGFSRVVVYFEQNENIYDAYLAKTAKVGATELTNKLSASGGSLHYDSEDKLYWKPLTVSAISSSNVTVSSADRNIHKGGLVKLGGAYYIITAYNPATNVVTLDGNPSDTLVGGTINFAIGNVIDTVGSETPGESSDINHDKTSDGYGYYKTSIDNVDDSMIESTTTSNGATRWEADINSNNLPDGPITIHYVVFDKAGNIAYDSIDAEVKNNNPRLASVTVWCDFDGNDSRTSDECRTKYYNGKKRFDAVTQAEFEAASDVTESLVVSGNGFTRDGKDPATGEDAGAYGSAVMTVKNTTYFIPEIIGGNGDLYYTYNWEDYAGTPKGSGYSSTPFGKGHDDNKDEDADEYEYLQKDYYGDSYVEGSISYNDVEYRFPVTEANLESIGNSASVVNSENHVGPTWFNYTIYDSTAGCNDWSYTASDWADGSATLPSKGRHKITFSVALNIQYSDTVAPKVNVKPFYYNSLTDNSIYGSAGVTKYSQLKGHIELEEDLKWTEGETSYDLTTKQITTTGGTAKAFGSDPKVSGMITIRGTAYDDIALKQLKVQFTSHSKIKDPTVAANYVNGSWGSTSADNSTNMTDNGWTFTANDLYNNESGHYVEWECNIDTSKIQNVADLDRVFTFVAVDARGNSKSGLSSSTTASKDVEATKDAVEIDVNLYNRPTYQMDVVPYIQAVTTKLSAGDEANPTKVSRTALGHYPVYQAIEGFGDNTSWDNEKVKVTGFNFTYDKTTYKEVTPDETAAYEGISTNGIPCLNNINRNFKSTLEESYNMQPNYANNNKLTDDVFFDVWQFNTKAAIGSSETGKADNLVMKINPSNGMIGMAFSSGTERFAMPDSKNGTTSYQLWSLSWDYLKWNGLAYDTNGTAFGCTVGGDVNDRANYADTFNFFVSKWGSTSTGTDWNKDVHCDGFNLGSIGQLGRKGQTSTRNDGVRYKNKNRFQSQSFATLRVPGTTDSTYLYLAYYDATNNEIRFHSGIYEDTTTQTNFGQFKDVGKAVDAYGTRKDDCQIIVDGTTNTITDADGNAVTAGQYVSIGVTSDNTVVLVWYDGQDLYYTYSNTTDMTTMVGTKGITKARWNPATKLLSSAGQYCKLAVDNANGIHIAAYGEKDTALHYVYLSSPSDTSPKHAVVDSYLDVGTQLTIDVAKVGDYQIPYIGYWGGFNQKPRYAYLAEPAKFTNGELNGADNDKYTGIWECTIIPAPNTANENLINVGVWKYAKDGTDGNLAYSTAGTYYGCDPSLESNNGEIMYASSTATTEKGVCYGNGTKNAVLGFSYDVGGAKRWIETAQMK